MGRPLGFGQGKDLGASKVMMALLTQSIPAWGISPTIGTGPITRRDSLLLLGREGPKECQTFFDWCVISLDCQNPQLPVGGKSYGAVAPAAIYECLIGLSPMREMELYLRFRECRWLSTISTGDAGRQLHLPQKATPAPEKFAMTNCQIG
jgi:hypothetical protein